MDKFVIRTKREKQSESPQKSPKKKLMQSTLESLQVGSRQTAQSFLVYEVAVDLYGPTLLPWNNSFHTSDACLKQGSASGQTDTNKCIISLLSGR